MLEHFYLPARAGAFYLCLSLAAAPALAGIVSFVSGKGVDAGDCSSPASPCRTFQYAHNQTLAGGEIKALDPANYFAVTINRAITIAGVPGAGILRSTAGDAVTVAAGANDRIQLHGLRMEGFAAATNGVRIASAGRVDIVDCVIRRFLGAGVRAEPVSGAMKVDVSDAIASDTAGAGIYFVPTGSGTVEGLVKRATLDNNSIVGLQVSAASTTGRADVRVVDSTANGNGDGFYIFSSNQSNATLLLDRVTSSGALSNSGLGVAGRAVARITRSIFTRNNFGITLTNANATVESFGDNVVRGNNLEINNPSGGAFLSVALR